MKWLQWLLDLLCSLLGSKKQSETDQQLGRVEQQQDDAKESEREDQVAQKIAEDNSKLSDDELAAKLRAPVSDRKPNGSANTGGI